VLTTHDTVQNVTVREGVVLLQKSGNEYVVQGPGAADTAWSLTTTGVVLQPGRVEDTNTLWVWDSNNLTLKRYTSPTAFMDIAFGPVAPASLEQNTFTSLVPAVWELSEGVVHVAYVKNQTLYVYTGLEKRFEITDVQNVRAASHQGSFIWEDVYGRIFMGHVLFTSAHRLLVWEKSVAEQGWSSQTATDLALYDNANPMRYPYPVTAWPWTVSALAWFHRRR
jgi:hypothetical protein